MFPAENLPLDGVLKRPYTTEVPMGCVGNRLWASSPQGWAFGSDVHWMYLSNLNVFDIELRDGKGILVPDQQVYTPSHIHIATAKRLDRTASASFTYATDKVENPLEKPFKPEKRWTSWSSGKREDWWQATFGAPRTLNGIKVWFFSDPPNGGCRPPESFVIQVWRNGAWSAVKNASFQPFAPKEGENTVRFDPVTSDRVRLAFKHAGSNFYTGLYGFEALGAIDRSQTSPTEFKVTADKYITHNDVLVSTIKVSLPKSAKKAAHFSVQVRSPYFQDIDSWSEGKSAAVDFETQGTGAVQGQKIAFALAGRAKGFDRPDEPGLQLEATLEPGQTATLHLAVGVDPKAPIAEHSAGVRRNDNLDDQIREYQSWFDKNVPTFVCSDPWVTKQYAHRAYNLRKNMMEPGLGRMKWPTFVEGRWRSGWYPNVITYGGGHQIREARWLRNPKYWEGHLSTYAENEKANGVYANYVRPDEIGSGQYTDWITSTAWDAYLVHPDRTYIASVAEKLATNVRGWSSTYDPDGDGLLRVDSHWWTGMEWQPSFFYFSDYKRGNPNGNEPVERVDLDRVDLTAYQYGNAKAAENIFRALGKSDRAQEFAGLAGRISEAMREKMWDPESGWFYSLRTRDGAVAKVKEVIGVYPFYFGALPAGQGYEAVWKSLIDPKQFWTKWPVASVSMECPAYSQKSWPDGYGTACMWNGPTWPHANSLVISAMGNSLRSNEGPSALTKNHLWDLFISFTKAQFKDQKLENPWTGEFYSGDTGEWKTGERDYNHSTYIDLVIGEIVGIVPRNDDVLEIHPLVPAGKLTYFLLDGVRYRGHDVSVVWDAPGGTDRFADGRKGMDVYVDGKRQASMNRLGSILVKL